MRAVIQLDNDTYKEAAHAVGIREKSKLIQKALQALIKQKALQELAQMYGVLKSAKTPRRRRFSW